MTSPGPSGTTSGHRYPTRRRVTPLDEDLDNPPPPPEVEASGPESDDLPDHKPELDDSKDSDGGHHEPASTPPQKAKERRPPKGARPGNED